MTAPINETSFLQHLEKTGKETYGSCWPLTGWLSAFTLKIGKSDGEVGQKLFDQLFDKETNLDAYAKKLRYFSPEQLNELKTRVAATGDANKNKASQVFEKALYFACARHHSGKKKHALYDMYTSVQKVATILPQSTASTSLEPSKTFQITAAAPNVAEPAQAVAETTFPQISPGQKLKEELQQKYCCPELQGMSEKELESLFLPFMRTDIEAETAKPAPFLLLPGKQGNFELVGGFSEILTPKGPRIQFGLKEQVFLAQDGKVRLGGRQYNDFPEFKQAWALGEFLYDAYCGAKLTQAGAEQRVKQARGDCFLMWKSPSDASMVSVRSGDKVDTYEIARDNGQWKLKGSAGELAVQGELTSFLSAQFKAAPYAQVQAFESVKGFIEQGQNLHDPQRISNLKIAKPKAGATCYVLTESVKSTQKLTLTEFTAKERGWGRGWVSSNIVYEPTRYEVSVLPNLQVVLEAGDGSKTTYNNIEAFKEHLQAMPSVHSLEKSSEEKQQKIDVNKKQIIENARFHYYKTKSEAKAKLEEFSSLLGPLAAEKYVLCEGNTPNSLLVMYKDAKGHTIEKSYEVTESSSYDALQAAVNLPPLSLVIGLKQKREEVIKRLEQMQAFNGPKHDTEKELSDYAVTLAHYKERPYTISSERDATGVMQFYLSYIDDTNTLQSKQLDTTSQAAIEKLFTVEDKIEEALLFEKSLGKPFKSVQDYVVKAHAKVESKNQEVTNHPSFQPKIVNNKQALEAFTTGKMPAGWLIRTVSEASSTFSRQAWGLATIPTFGAFYISSYDGQDKVEDHLVTIDPFRGSFMVGSEEAKTLEDVVKKLGLKSERTVAVLQQASPVPVVQEQERKITVVTPTASKPAPAPAPKTDKNTVAKTSAPQQEQKSVSEDFELLVQAFNQIVDNKRNAKDNFIAYLKRLNIEVKDQKGKSINGKSVKADYALAQTIIDWAKEKYGATYQLADDGKLRQK